MVHRLTAIFTGFLVVVLVVLMIAGCASTASAPSTTTGGTVTTVAGETTLPSQGGDPGDVIVDQWFGNIGKEAIMERLDTLVAIG